MKNERGGKSFFLPILVSFLLLAGSFYAHYNELSEIDFLSSQPAFENGDLEVTAADNQNKAKFFVLAAVPVLFSYPNSFFLPINPHSPLLRRCPSCLPLKKSICSNS